MTAYSKASFKSLYGSAGGSFNNTLAGTITGTTIQTFANDLADSTLFVDSYLNTDVNYFESWDWFGLPSGAFGYQGIAGGTASGVAALGNYGVDATERAMGVVSNETGTQAIGFSILYKKGYQIGLGHTLRLRKRCAVETLGSVGENYTTYFGFGDQITVSGEPSNGIYFRYNYAVNSGKIECVTANGGVRTATDSGVTMDTTYHIYEIRVNSAGTSIDFYIDGANLKTNTTNIPASSTVLSNILTINKSAGTTTRKCHEDYCDFTMNLASTR